MTGTVRDHSPSTPTYENLLICAVDHRASLESDLYGLTAPPTPAQAAKIAGDKLLVYEGVVDALPQLPGSTRAGLLIDEHYGATAAELASLTGRIDLAMPVEESGQEWFHFEYGEDWRRHAEYFPAAFSKILVRDNPRFGDSDRNAQAAKLSQVISWSREVGRPVILELLVPATPADLATVDGSADRYDREVRGAATVRVMEYLQDRGVEPAIWKVEGLESRADAEAVARTARRGGRAGRCVVLGRHAPREKLDRWLAIAAPVEGFVGFAIGRSIWWEALDHYVRGRTGRDEARAAVTEAYVGYARYYVRARAGEVNVPA
ncbi:2-deoxy-5-keto-D-gluconate 6-phosphate aldolase domain-containing protein [Streptomyces liangshanensis]|uniref:DUF2090 domain-containing protein n=1 Tax=Streptomyces liangshanensis TaxID=2717324 RepID=A0A6G9GSL7_9ACTN|nr:DUF2090 domain-containing protein [Streptomyces liangshanensis]QIQ01242.1 DUF2090 domain-containing protein [Streptomyces liangshanensis]